MERGGEGGDFLTHPSSLRASAVAFPKSYAGHDAGQEGRILLRSELRRDKKAAKGDRTEKLGKGAGGLGG